MGSEFSNRTPARCLERLLGLLGVGSLVCGRWCGPAIFPASWAPGGTVLLCPVVSVVSWGPRPAERGVRERTASLMEREGPARAWLSLSSLLPRKSPASGARLFRERDGNFGSQTPETMSPRRHRPPADRRRGAGAKVGRSPVRFLGLSGVIIRGHFLNFYSAFLCLP